MTSIPPPPPADLYPPAPQMHGPVEVELLPAAGEQQPKLNNTPTPPEFTDADRAHLADLAVQWHDATAGIEKWQAIKDEAAAAIRALLPPGQSFMVPGTGVGVAVKRPASRFAEAVAVEYLTRAGVDYTPAATTKLDPAVLKALLKANGLNDAMLPGTGGAAVTAAKG